MATEGRYEAQRAPFHNAVRHFFVGNTLREPRVIHLIFLSVIVLGSLLRWQLSLLQENPYTAVLTWLEWIDLVPLLGCIAL